MGRLKYEPQLDGLRALAVLAVVLHHAPTRLGEGGYIGVDVFFVLSGFLITTLLKQEFAQTATVSLRDFYRRRVRRLAPALVAVTAFVVVIWAAWPYASARTETFRGAPIALGYVSSWVAAFNLTSLGWFGHTWSLSVEEHFYLLWPLAFLVFARRSERALVTMTAVAATASTLEWYAGHALGWSFNRLYFAPDTRAKDILVGCLLAHFITKLDRKWLTRLALPAALGLVGWAAVVPQTSNAYMLGWPLVLGAAVVVIAAVHLRPMSAMARTLAHPALVWVGVRSYAIYLIHYPLDSINGPVIHHARAEKAVVFVIYVALSIGLADLSYRFVESRFRSHNPVLAASA